MNLLRETIRRMVIESVCDQTNNKIQQAISELEFHKLKVKVNKSPKAFAIRIFSDSQNVAYLDAYMTSDLPCRGAFIIGYTEVMGIHRGKSGFGALIYDIALELAGTAGLASDRDMVSGDAFGMWRYLYSSSDYDKKPFDTADGEFTPEDPSDDCDNYSYLEHGGDFNDDKEDFQSHPLSNVYYKKDQSQPTIRCLREKNLLSERTHK